MHDDVITDIFIVRRCRNFNRDKMWRGISAVRKRRPRVN